MSISNVLAGRKELVEIDRASSWKLSKPSEGPGDVQVRQKRSAVLSIGQLVFGIASATLGRLGPPIEPVGMSGRSAPA